MLNPNLSKDLLKLSINERLNIMMHYRAAKFVAQATPISEVEYNALDTSIKRTAADINAYNVANHAFICLHHQFDCIVKKVVSVSLNAHYFQALWLVNGQTNCVMEAVSYFMDLLPRQVELNDQQLSAIHKLMNKALNNSFILFHDFDCSSDADGNTHVDAVFREPEKFQERVAKLEDSILQIKTEIEEYYRLEKMFNLILIPFQQVLPNLRKEGEAERKWLEWLKNSEF